MHRQGVEPASLSVLAGLVVSGLLLAIAPLAMPASYSWVAHTTSESAAQGVPYAWVARSAFVVFGGAVIALAVLGRAAWGPLGALLHTAFGAGMIAAAAFSARPWVADAPYDPVEDLLHSIAATAMGFAFALGVVAVAYRRHRKRVRIRALDLVAVAASIVLPLGMAAIPAVTGLLQRAMFLIAYLWFGREAVRVSTARITSLARKGSSSGAGR